MEYTSHILHLRSLGTLGLGPDVSFSLEPTRIHGKSCTVLEIVAQIRHVYDHSEQGQTILCLSTALSHVRVVAAACGENFTLGLTSEGDLFSWGCAKDGKLGKDMLCF